MEQTPFCVRDAKTKEDITRSILLQIIMEQEEDGEPIFSEQVLQQIIRFYGDSLQDMIATYLEKSVQLFADQQKSLREQMHNVMSGDPLNFMRDVTEQNLALWKDMQASFLGTGVARSPRRAKTTRAGKERAPSRKS